MQKKKGKRVASEAQDQIGDSGSGQGKRNQSQSSNQDIESLSASSSEDEVEYKWSQVLSLHYREYLEPPSFMNTINYNHYMSDIKSAVGRPIQSWDYLFTPGHFDKSVDISQFQAQPLPVDDMEDYGIKVSLIRQELIERAMKAEQNTQDPA